MGERRSRRSNRAPPCWRADRADSGGAPSLAAAIQASAASRAAKRLLPPTAALDSITPSHSTGCSDEPSLPSSLVAETTRNPQIPQPAKPRRKPQAEIDLTPPPEPHRRRSPTPRNSRAKTRRGAHLGRIWTKSRARGRLSDARAALPPAPPPQRRNHASTPAEAWGPAARRCCSGARSSGVDGSERTGAEEMGRRVRVAGLRFCCAAAAAWRARDTSREKGRGREEETGGSRLATVGGGAYRWATRGFARLKIRVGGGKLGRDAA